jgi:hypothetical protein
MPDNFEVVYNSDLIIRDPGEAATLCLFYDRVFLPHVSNPARVVTMVDNDENRVLRTTFHAPDAIHDWELRHSILFKEQVIKRLPPELFEFETYARLRVYDVDLRRGSWSTRYSRTTGHWGYFSRLTEKDLKRPDDRLICQGTETLRLDKFDVKGKYLKSENIKSNYYLIERPIKKLSKAPENSDGTMVLSVSPSSIPALRVESIYGVKYVRADLVQHQLRTDIELPQIYSNLDQQKFLRDIMISLEAKAVFSYLLPRIRVVDAQQILELRRKTADTREGFAMHLQKLSRGLHEHAKQGTPIEEVAKFAKDLIETELIPDYREFKRQLEGIKARNWKNFLDPVCKVAAIDATVWTPSFWSQLLKSLGFAILETTAEQQERLTNRYQAFKFMSQVEAASARRF